MVDNKGKILKTPNVLLIDLTVFTVGIFYKFTFYCINSIISEH